MAEANKWTAHALHRPPGDEMSHAPLLVLLHGYGSHEADLFSLAEGLPARYRIVSLRAPYTTAWGGFAWYPLEWGPQGLKSDVMAARDTVVRLNSALEALEAQWDAPPGQTILLGFSQGAIVSLAMALGLPDRYAFVLAYSGYWDGGLLPLQRGMRDPFLFLAHGRLDDVVPFDRHEQSKTLLREQGLELHCFEADYGHGIPPEALRAAAHLLNVF
ncbi:hypothetical protein GC167_04070 [bacterium]|nr:hypothetical protein [bacterium]